MDEPRVDLADAAGSEAESLRELRLDGKRIGFVVVVGGNTPRWRLIEGRRLWYWSAYFLALYDVGTGVFSTFDLGDEIADVREMEWGAIVIGELSVWRIRLGAERPECVLEASEVITNHEWHGDQLRLIDFGGRTRSLSPSELRGD